MCNQLSGWDQARPEHAVGEPMIFRHDAVAAKLGVDVASTPTFVRLNCSMPCNIPAPMNDCQLSTMTWALRDNMQSASLVTCPVLTCNKGNLHVEERRLLENLLNGNHNLD